MTYLSFVALGILVQFVGWLLINFAQGYLRASIVAPVLLVQPVLTALLAANVAYAMLGLLALTR